MTAHQKIVDRIVKLFRLGSDAANTTEAEMQLAATKAKQLMVAHSISEAELAAACPDPKVISYVVTQRNVYTRRIANFAVYDGYVAQAAERITQTKCLISRSRSIVHGRMTTVCTMTFVGVEADVAVAGELFMVLLTGVRAMARQKFGSTSWGKLHTSYAVGVAVRLRDRADAQVAVPAPQAETYALVVRGKTDAISTYMHSAFPSLRAQKRRNSLDGAAYAAGYQDGALMSLTSRSLKGV